MRNRVAQHTVRNRSVYIQSVRVMRCRWPNIEQRKTESKYLGEPQQDYSNVMVIDLSYFTLLFFGDVGHTTTIVRDT